MRLIDHAPQFGIPDDDSMTRVCLGTPSREDGTERTPLSFVCPCCKQVRIAVYFADDGEKADGLLLWGMTGNSLATLTLSHPIPVSFLDDGKHPDLRIVEGRFV